MYSSVVPTKVLVLSHKYTTNIFSRTLIAEIPNTFRTEIHMYILRKKKNPYIYIVKTQLNREQAQNPTRCKHNRH